MVENFTEIYEQTCNEDVKETSLPEIDETFEAKIKHSIQNLAKEPSSHIVNNILSYSKSFTSK